MEESKAVDIVEDASNDGRRKSGRVAEKPVVEKPVKAAKKTKAEKKVKVLVPTSLDSLKVFFLGFKKD